MPKIENISHIFEEMGKKVSLYQSYNDLPEQTVHISQPETLTQIFKYWKELLSNDVEPNIHSICVDTAQNRKCTIFDASQPTHLFGGKIGRINLASALALGYRYAGKSSSYSNEINKYIEAVSLCDDPQVITAFASLNLPKYKQATEDKYYAEMLRMDHTAAAIVKSMGVNLGKESGKGRQ